MCHSKLISGDIERAMENTEDINVPVVLDEVSNPVMFKEKYAHLAGRCRVALPLLGKGGEVLCSLEDTLDSAGRGSGTIGGDVLENFREPALGFRGPCYLCHERMRRAMSAFEITRFASESASPRSSIM